MSCGKCLKVGIEDHRSAEDVAQKAPSTAKQVESEWLRLRTVVELLIRNRGWITDSDHFAELLTMETLEAT
ncbi:unnamed protein product [Peronospora effusa]|nr:unnamed protein product [Peronospora effusa]